MPCMAAASGRSVGDRLVHEAEKDSRELDACTIGMSFDRSGLLFSL